MSCRSQKYQMTNETTSDFKRRQIWLLMILMSGKTQRNTNISVQIYIKRTIQIESEKVNSHAVLFSAPLLLFLVGKLRFWPFNVIN